MDSEKLLHFLCDLTSDRQYWLSYLTLAGLEDDVSSSVIDTYLPSGLRSDSIAQKIEWLCN